MGGTKVDKAHCAPIGSTQIKTTLIIAAGIMVAAMWVCVSPHNACITASLIAPSCVGSIHVGDIR
jgi:hypothetical protein